MSKIASIGGVRLNMFRSLGKVLRAMLACLVFIGLVARASAVPDTTNSNMHLQPARWLLVVDMSSKMERRLEAMEGVINELLLSSMNGQMHEGDELGIWTFNKKLYAGVAPMQIWHVANSNLIAGRSAAFFGRQKFESKPNFELVVPELDRVVKESRRLTILVFSDGSQKVSGTPFDDAINAAYEERKADAAKSRMPVVTVLRSERGKYIGQTVSIAPWPVEFPPFAPEPQAKPKPATTTKPAAPAPKKAIIIGEPKKPTSSTNVLVLPPSTDSTNQSAVTEIKPLPVVPVQPTPVVEPAPTPAIPVPQPEALVTKAAEPTKVEPQPEPVPEISTKPPAPMTTPPSPTSPAASARSTGSQNIAFFSSRQWLMILGIGCMWIAIIIALVLARRSRHAHGTSLITQSFDRNQR